MNNRSTTRTQRLHSDQRGMVSIIITVILMLVISITVLAFAQIIRREQRQSLDRQLSSQAFYAAESGINDARQYIAERYSATTPPDKDQCDNTGQYQLPGITGSTIDAEYTCVLVTGSPDSLTYDLSTTKPSKIVPLDSSGGAIKSLELRWTSPSPDDPLAGCPSSYGGELPFAGDWSCGYGLIRIDLVPTNGALKRDQLMKDTFTAFFVPTLNGDSTVGFTGSGSNIHGGSANQGANTGVTCDATDCSVTITGLSGPQYYARVSTLYENATLHMVAKDGLGNPLSLKGAQIVIDSTGRSHDVLRRVQVRVPLANEGTHADYGLETTDSICKQFVTFDATYLNNAGCP